MDLDDFDDFSSHDPPETNGNNFAPNINNFSPSFGNDFGDMYNDFGDSNIDGMSNFGTLPPLSSLMNEGGYMQPDMDSPPVFFNENTRFVNVASTPCGRACACCALILFILLILAGLGVLGLSILAIIFSVQIRDDVNHLRLNIAYPIQPVAPPPPGATVY
jgi:hypothetical protein